MSGSLTQATRLVILASGLALGLSLPGGCRRSAPGARAGKR